MGQMIAAFVIIGLAGVIMLMKWPGPAFGYLYCVAVGLLMAGRFLYPFTSTTYEVLHCMTLGAGIGSVAGLAYAMGIKLSGDMGSIIGGAVLMPILMFIVGVALIFVLGIVGMFQNGSSSEVVTSGLVLCGLIAGIFGGGGSIIVIIFGK